LRAGYSCAKYLQIPTLTVFSITVIHPETPVTGCFLVCNATSALYGPFLVL